MNEFMNNKEFREYLINSPETQECLRRKYQEFMESKNCVNREAYVLRLVTKKKVVVCESCYEQGQVNPKCSRCGGKGTHNKGYQCFEVSPHKIKIEKISRDPQTGKLRYYTSANTFYYEEVHNSDNRYIPEYPHGVHFIHFSFKEAVDEVNRLNAIRKQRGEM